MPPFSKRGLDGCRRVDNNRRMASPVKSPRTEDRKIVGFSLAPSLASKVKAEAGRRQISLKALFAELWELYEKHGNGKKRS